MCVGLDFSGRYQARGALCFFVWIQCPPQKYKVSQCAFSPIVTLEHIMVATPDFTDSNQLLPDQVTVFEQYAVSAFFAHLLSVVLRI